jgi:hypothetical protein
MSVIDTSIDQNVTGVRSVNKQDLIKNLKFFNVPETNIQSIYSKLAMRVFDVYANILKCMYSTRFSGGLTRSETFPETQPTPIVVTPLIHTIDISRPDKYKRWRKEMKDQLVLGSSLPINTTKIRAYGPLTSWSFQTSGTYELVGL